ncbi:hypothetical protein FA10DRAFT_264336 [Acaromyces ingoldii]|uniref:Secreted protein n=1 Tax=Acaromyces ingoldii TaxID=215250 RepID=A0A316YXE3_9BASI|nr:hypothetical protein FA10DRAFT_264336 [Acaromyces ingoldii]PWN93726.1 hypothetical protein FA10DRAFT_264336 [Acaromyces ingoldii]
MLHKRIGLPFVLILFCSLCRRLTGPAPVKASLASGTPIHGSSRHRASVLSDSSAVVCPIGWQTGGPLAAFAYAYA